MSLGTSSNRPRHAILGIGFLLLIPASASAQPYSADLAPGPAGEPIQSSHDCTASADNPIVNCSFETGDFTGWGIQDLTTPFVPIQVNIGGLTPGFGFFSSAPTQGTFAMLNGFDGDGATGATDTITLFQELTLPAGTESMEFDYRGAWDMTFGATQQRVFSVEIEPPGGGAAMQSDVILTADPNTTVTDTGPLSAVVDLSSFGNSSVRISFEWLVPEDFVGPGFFQVDNVEVTVVPVPDDPIIAIPTLSEVGLVVMAVLLAGLSLLFVRRRRSASSGPS